MSDLHLSQLSSAQNVRDGLMWSTQALGSVRPTSVTTVILTQILFTSVDEIRCFNLLCEMFRITCEHKPTNTDSYRLYFLVNAVMKPYRFDFIVF